MIMSQDSHTQSSINQIGDMLDDGLILTDLNGVILSANPAAVRWFSENLTGQMIFDVINHPNIGDLFAKAADGATRCEMRYEPTNIIKREFRMRLQRIGDQSVALLFLDMTLQRNLEKVRRDFVANVSHELRSPLTSLAGFVETMLSDEVPDPAMRTRFLTIMDEEAKRMSRLIDDLLSLSRVEVDEHIIPDNRVNIAELLHSVGDSMSGRAMKKNMNIKIIQPNDAQSRSAPPVIFGKHDEITEVFVNLLENAIKYGFNGSDITLAITMVAPRHVRIDVTNFGEGIEERHLPRLTERFYRVDKARSRQIGGTGLGLAIVKHIVNRHRGSLSITSTLGETTKFSVDFPLAPAVTPQ
jgi:two-component system, OmpR family, phosphate regulon sensor histidine kinase PhoR